MKRPVHRFRFLDPLHMSGLAAIFMLLVPGTVSGLLRLLTYAGYPVGGAAIPSQTHALIQLYGFFVVLIWGFLTNSLPGLVGVAPWLKHIRIAIAVTTGGLVLLLASHLGLDGYTGVGYGLVFAGSLVATVLSLTAAIMGGRKLLERPTLLLLAGLIIPPFAALAAWVGVPAGVSAKFPAELLLYGCVVPVVLAMGYRMFSSLGGLNFTRPHFFDAATVAWFVAMGLLVGDVWFAVARVWINFAFLVSWFLFAVAAGVFEPRRKGVVRRQVDPVEQAVGWHIRISFWFLLLGPLIGMIAGTLPSTGLYYGEDIARHFVAIGFALLIVMAVTQRMYPALLRGKRSSGRWMLVNAGLVTTGLLLRTTEIWLPSTSKLVALSAIFLTAGIASFGIHLLRGIIVPSNVALQPIQPIGKKRPMPKPAVTGTAEKKLIA